MTDHLAMNFDHNLIDNGTSDDYYTPKHIFDALNMQFDLDVASPVGGIPWVPATSYLTQMQDGLITDWHGTVWMNPPYSAPRLWIEKFVDHADGICLVPTSKAAWFKYIWNTADSVMCMEPNLKFVRGNTYAQIPYMTIMFGFGVKSVLAMQGSNLGRVRC